VETPQNQKKEGKRKPQNVEEFKCPREDEKKTCFIHLGKIRNPYQKGAYKPKKG